jgi:tetratricopeptide (TPR) repeat protein
MLLAASACADSAFDSATRGDDLLFQRRYAQAARQYENALIELNDRRDVEGLELRRATLEKLGEVRHLYLNDPQAALRAYRAASEVAPGSESSFQARLRLVHLLRDRLGDPAAAASELAAVIDSFPERDGIEKLRLEEAQLSFRAGHYRQALESADAVWKAGTHALRIEAAMLMASIHEVEGRTEAALRIYQDMLEMPLRGEVASNIRFELGHCHEAMGDLPGALAHYTLARRDAPDLRLIDARMEHIRARIEASAHPRRASAPIAARQPARISPLRQD